MELQPPDFAEMSNLVCRGAESCTWILLTWCDTNRAPANLGSDRPGHQPKEIG